MGSDVICIDSSGWIERLVDGPQAAGYNRVMESVSPDQIVTSVVSLFEVYRKVRTLKGEADALSAVAALKATTVVPVDERIALEAADYSISLKLHFADALIYATARRFGAPLHTSDPDLKGHPDVVFHGR